MLSRQRLGPAVEDIQVFTISKDATSLFARHLTHDPEVNQVFERLSNSGKR